MIAHITINVSNIIKSKEFYSEALKPLGYKLSVEYEEEKVVAFKANGKTDFWLYGGGCKETMHVAFAATSKEMVDAFYELAIDAGGKDNGEPGYHTEYHEGYYGAFVFDPDGHNIEAVWHDPEK